MPGEDGFLEWLARSSPSHPSLEVPIGDDGAVFRAFGNRLLAVADAIAEGTHFLASAAPEDIGAKALAINLSDIAAMGGRPLFALATAALPLGFQDELPRRITDGMRAMGDRWSCPLIGGDTISHAGGIVISVTVIGELIAEPVTRRGAKPGQVIGVTGPLGGSLRGRHLAVTPRLKEAARCVVAGPPSAMMDISDGLLLDLGRLADASGVGFRIDAERVPIHADVRGLPGDPVTHALSDGEDFELLVVADEHAFERMEAAVPLTRIGVTTASSRTLVVEGVEVAAERLGFRHD